MKLGILLCIFGCLPFVHLSAQNIHLEKDLELVVPSNQQRYGIDFSINEWNTIDTSILDQLDLAQYEANRTELADVDIFINDYNITLKLFSQVKTLENESNSKIRMRYFHHLYFKDN